MQGVLGYVILRPLMTAVGFVASLIGVYGDGELRFDRVYLYTTIVSNISQVCHTAEQAASTEVQRVSGGHISKEHVRVELFA